MSTEPSIAIGTCAWSFDDWRGVFYPEHLPAGERLAFYAQHFPSVEVDSTFYHPPAAHVAQHWAEATPPHFLFSAKLPREITHERGLRESTALVREFVESLKPLGEKLGCVLVQLPPYFTPERDEHALRDFVRHLPPGARFAIEFRDPDWHHPRIVHLLSDHGVCWAWNDTSATEHASEAAFGSWPHTTDFLYVRMLGDLETKYAPDGARVHHYRKLSWPRDDSLDNWVEKVRAHPSQVKRAFLYVNNHFEGFAPATAVRIAERLGVLLKLPSVEELRGGDSKQMRLL